MNKLYYCQADGGQWNIPVVLEHTMYGLCLIRGLTSDLCGKVGGDGHVYALVHKEELYKEEQSNVVSIR